MRKNNKEQGGNIKKKRKKNGFVVFLKVYLITFLICAVICYLVVYHEKVFNYLKSFNRNDATLTGLEIKTGEECRKKWENTQSDIEGLTVWDKYEQKLAVNSGSDTDGDGLTDKEEIEIYHSDPLKLSTADDLYTDKYKVENGMDVKTYYDYKEEENFPYNECEEVILQAEIPTDFNAVVKHEEQAKEIAGQEVFDSYEIYNYSGIVKIDLDKTLTDNNVDVDSVAVYLSDGANIKKTAFSCEGTVISLKKPLNADYEYSVYICSDNTIGSARVLFNGLDTVTEVEKKEVTGDALIMGFPLISFFCGNPMIIDYQDMGEEELNIAHRNKVLANTKEVVSLFIYDNPKYYVDEFITATALADLKWEYGFLNFFLPSFDISEVEDSEISIIHLFFFYYSYEKRTAYIDEEENHTGTVDVAVSDGFQGGDGFEKYELPFENFGSDISDGGNCAGIAHLTSYLYNTGSYPEKGQYFREDGELVEWNLALDSENYTLMDPELYDYKDSSFVKMHEKKNKILDTDSLSAGEQEFVKMIGAAWAEGNDRAGVLFEDKYGGLYGNREYDYSLIEKIIAQLDSGKILDLYLASFSNKEGKAHGHAVNIYGYEYDSENPDTVLFYIYDNNYPDGDPGDSKLTNLGFKMKVTKKLKRSGDGYTFSYLYKPVVDQYEFSSNRAVNVYPFLLVFDEEWNDLNTYETETGSDFETGFTLGKDNNSFMHTKSSFFSTDEKIKYLIDDDYLHRLTNRLSWGNKHQILKQQKKKWKGSCYGIACTIALLYDHDISIQELSDGDELFYYDLGKPVENRKLRNMINYYHLSQYLPQFDENNAVVTSVYKKDGKYKNRNKKNENDSLVFFLEHLVAHTKQNPGILTYEYWNENTSKWSGHAVLVLDVKENEDGSFDIVVYDENNIDDTLEMHIGSDYGTFTFTDGNNNTINQDDYSYIKLTNPERLYSEVNSSSESDDSYNTIVFSGDSEFTIWDDNGNCLTNDEQGLSGDIGIVDIDVIACDSDGSSVDVMLVVDESNEYSIESLGDKIDISIASNESFYSVSGENISTISMKDGVIELDGEDYIFDVSIASYTSQSSTDLVSYSGDSDGKIQVMADEERIKISGSEEIDNLVAYNYITEKEYTNLKENKNGQYSVIAGTRIFMIKKYWWVMTVIATIVTMSLAVIILVNVKKLMKK